MPIYSDIFVHEVQPFKDAKDCFIEMKKHQPFGLIKEVFNGLHLQILSFDDDGIYVFDYEDGNLFYSYDAAAKVLKFADDSKFGLCDFETGSLQTYYCN